jgi:hypothetical protein
MFNHHDAFDEALRRRGELTAAEQWCSKCERWTAVPVDVVRAYLEAHVPPADPVTVAIGIPVSWFKCQHCGNDQLVICPGKYDKLRGSRFSCQRYRFSGDPTIGAPSPAPVARRPKAPRRRKG